MDPKLPENLTPEQEMERLLTLRCVYVLRKELEEAERRLTDPQCSSERLAALLWPRDAWLAARGHKDLERVARMEFFEVLHNARIEVRDHGERPESAAEHALLTCATLWPPYWFALWRDRGSGDVLEQCRDAIAVWVRGEEQTEAGGASTLALLRRARLANGKMRLPHELKQWARAWRHKGGGRFAAELFPHPRAPQPAALAASKGKSKPGPKPASVTIPVKERGQLIDRPELARSLHRYLNTLRPTTTEAANLMAAKIFPEKN